MEEEIKPKIINILDSLNKNYSKLQKYQVEKLNCLLESRELSVSKNKNFKKIQEILVDNFKNLQIAPHVVEELVQSHYKENKKLKYFVLANFFIIGIRLFVNSLKSNENDNN